MKVLYLDSGALIKLYVVELGSDFVAEAVQAAQILSINSLQETEVRNALFAARGRNELTEPACQQALDHFSHDIAAGVFRRASPDWPAIWNLAQTLARDHTSTILCRTLDILHVALALSLRADALASGDKRQIALCRAIGMDVIEMPAREIS
jgi:predicted nucleic acid-binding protein